MILQRQRKFFITGQAKLNNEHYVFNSTCVQLIKFTTADIPFLSVIEQWHVSSAFDI